MNLQNQGTISKKININEPRGQAQRRVAVRKADYSLRDKEAQVTFYLNLWKRKGISLEKFYNYWKNVHGPVCARLPGQYQYWQFHITHNEGGLWPNFGDLVNASAPEEQFDAIAELTFKTAVDRQTWFKAASILMDDEYNIFSKAIGYTTSYGNSITYVDCIENGEPNGKVGALKYHCMIRKADLVSLEEFRQYLKEKFAPKLAQNERVVKLRLHLFDEVDNTRPPAAGVSHFEPPELQYQAALEIGFWNRLDIELLLESPEYQQAVKEHPKYIKDFKPFPETKTYTFVYEGQMTLAGQRSAKVANLITKIGAANQLKQDVVSLMLNNTLSTINPTTNGKVETTNGKLPSAITGLGHWLQGVQHVGVTVSDLDKSLEFYTEVLGGEVVVGEHDLTGDSMQNNLFQKEELDAIAQGVSPAALEIPNLRDGDAKLDVKFISFGNAVVELIYFKDGDKPNSPKPIGSIPSQIGHVNAMHLSFHVKEDVDLNEFVEKLEAECQKRGLTEVKFNRVVYVRSEAERRAVARKYNSFKFWDEPETLAAGKSHHWGDMEGWALCYCKGPNGEQLEFNQVTRNVKTLFKKAQEEYNQATGTSFEFPEATINHKLHSAITGINHWLQGIQHIGVTVSDFDKSLEFYTEVLGGKVAVGEQDLVGDTSQNTLFQKEELDALSYGVSLKALEVPNIRDSEDKLDVKFISFGNAVVELIYFKDGTKPNSPPKPIKSVPSQIGHVNAMHLSFHVKEDVDLNDFAQELEAECHRRGITNVTFNRVIRVKSAAEKREVARKYSSIKFWNDPELLAAGQEPTEWGEFEGWALFYCKGPNGEQLEFNQATRNVKKLFKQAQQDYNKVTGTAFKYPEATFAKYLTKNSYQDGESMIYTTYSTPVNASATTVWYVLRDKTEHPERYNMEASNCQVLERYNDGIMRHMNAMGMNVKEKITIDDGSKIIRHQLVDNSLFTGDAVNAVVEPVSENPDDPVIVTYTVDWRPINEQGQTKAAEIHNTIVQAVRQAVINTKLAAEKLEAEGMAGSEQFPGTNTDLVKRLFSRGEAFDSEGFITFFTDKPLYQFGNFDVCLDKESIRKSADNFFSQINAVYHEIKMMWEVGDVVFVEMDVLYWRKDGSMVSLPCFDIFRVEGNKFSELRIFMDVNPVFDASIPVPPSASILTLAEGKKLIPPGTMRRHFAEHPEAKQRVAQGYGPKWSADGPRWPIGSGEVPPTEKSSAQLQAVGELSQNIMAQDWEKVKTYLTDDIYYKVGSADPVHGPEAVVNFFKTVFKTKGIFSGHKPRKLWQDSDIVTLEMDAYYELVPSKKNVTISCCDVYRMTGNKVSEWRVYADMTPWDS
ncbi:MAG: DUF1857 family protein [Microcoleaceae cyanobacterium MO_207.B10]|nr:DUF1857 family protein [Microcoleaceae cyanobacterium MO_207.B10]